MDKYKLSFAFEGLCIPETVILSRNYNLNKDWDVVKMNALKNNILKKTKISSRKRYFREVKYRLERAYSWETELINNGEDFSVHRIICYLIVCRYYSFIRDFILEVIRKKILSNDYCLNDYDYPLFFEKKCEKHPELLNIAQSTQKNIFQVIMRMLYEAGIKKSRNTNIIQKPEIPITLLNQYFSNNCNDDLAVLFIEERKFMNIDVKENKDEE